MSTQTAKNMIQLQKSITEAAGKRRGRVSAREGGLLAEAAQCTRSESREMIRSGRVSVNGAVCKRPEQQVSEMDSIQLDGKSRPRQAFVYIMLNKPAGVVSASSDRRDTTVVDLVRSAYPRRELFPAGRLDKTSTGISWPPGATSPRPTGSRWTPP